MNFELSDTLDTASLLFGDLPSVIPPGDISSIAVTLGAAFLGTAGFIGGLSGIINDARVRVANSKPRQYKLVNKKTKRRRIDFRMRVLCRETKLFKPTKGTEQ